MNTNLLAMHDLTLNDYEVLLHLSWAPEGRLRRVELAERIHLTASGVTRLLEGLHRSGLVTSTPSRDDRRAIDTQLTPAGHRRLAEAARTHVEDITTMFASRYSHDELAMLGELLGRLTAPTAR